MSQTKTKLENKIYSVFKKCGFKVKRKKRLGGFEFDVYAEFDRYKIICECDCEMNDNALFNLIEKVRHINNEFQADKVVLVVSGFEVLGENKQRASEYNILIWDDVFLDVLTGVVNSDPLDGKNKLLGELGIKTYSDPKAEYLGQSMNY